MGPRSFLRWFFAPDPNNAHIGPPGAQGMVVLDRTPPKTTQQVRAEQKALPPRQWSIYQGDGRRIGVATENTDTEVITVAWEDWTDAPEQTSYVDEDAMDDDLHAGPEGRARIQPYGFIYPIRVRFHPRNDYERQSEELKASFF